MIEGHIEALWRFPVLGMRGEELRSSQVDTRGIAGDRTHFVRGPEGRLSTHDLPRLADWTASFPFNPDGAIVPERPPPFPLLKAPAGLKAWRWGDPRLLSALERDLGRSVELVRDPELTRGVIVSLHSPGDELAMGGINVRLNLAGHGAGWSGRELTFRDGVRLRLVASRGDGPGIEARVVVSGRLLVGEPVTLS